jgi:hypothetical protein
MTDPTMPTLAELEVDLAISEAELAVGDFVSAEAIYAEEQAALDELAARRSARPRRGALRHP